MQTQKPALFARILRAVTKTVLLMLLLFLPLAYASRNHQKLRAEYVVETADYGIPGITKAYSARLINRGFLPVKIQVCSFISDVGERGKTPAYTIERLD